MMKFSKPAFLVPFLLLSTIIANAQWERNFIKTLNELHYDSVKVFYFNCGTDKLRNAPKLVDEKQNWTNVGNRAGRIVSNKDLNDIFNLLLKNNSRYRERFNKPIFKNGSLNIAINDPVACYQPRMGFAFYKYGLVNAHIDVCLECYKAKMEIFSDASVSYHQDWEVLVDESISLFIALCKKYELQCCNK